MTIAALPVSYCTNVHPGLTVDTVVAGLAGYATEVQHRVQAAGGQQVAAGLWLPQPVTQSLLADSGEVTRVRQALEAGGLTCYTLNAFPFGNFHSERVKDNVYLPDWTTDERRLYTQDCARLLAQLCPAGMEGSISTLPLAFKRHIADPWTLDDCERPGTQPFFDRCQEQLLDLAQFLDELFDDTGTVIRLAIEPEPLCVLETTKETIHFFDRLRSTAAIRGCGAVVERHLGVCFDVCHQAVEFEDVADAIARLNAHQIRINKVHLSNAIEVFGPGSQPAVLAGLERFAEPRYLHQTFARFADGSIAHHEDLTSEWCAALPAAWRDARVWRVHFHVPIHAKTLGIVGTTQDDLQSALVAVHELDYAPHLEVETYTWSVLAGEQPVTLATGIADELLAAQRFLQDARRPRGFVSLL